MNVWECEHPGCARKCIGTGGAVGLRAIGWWFVPGPKIYCPAHRPDPVPCIEEANNHLCHLCAAELEADKWQRPMSEALGFKLGEPHEQWAARMRGARNG